MRRNKMYMLGASAVALSGLLFSFTSGDDEGKMKRYRIMHQKDGVQVQYDTLIPMTSDFTTDDFLAAKGIDATDVKVINLSEMAGGAMGEGPHKMKFIHMDDEGMEGENVQIKVSIDDEGNKTVVKTVNGKEVELTEEELAELEKRHEGRNKRVRIMKGAPGDGENVWIEDHKSENVEIKVEIDEDGNMKTVKKVNGKEVELTEEELAEIERNRNGSGENVMIMKKEMLGEGDDMNFVVKDEDGENVEIKVEVDEDGNTVIKKFVNGEEVEVSEDEFTKIEGMGDGEHKMIIIQEEVEENVFSSDEEGEGEEKRVEIKVEVDDEGNMTTKKFVNGEEVELTEEELTEIKDRHEEHKARGEKGERVRVRRMHKGHHGKPGREIHREMKVMTMGGDEDYTIVLVEENVDPNAPTRVRTKNTQSMELGNNNSIEVYPNPNEGVFTLAFNQEDKAKTSIQVLDINGKVVYKEKLGKFSGEYRKEIDLKKFGSGTYLINVLASDKTSTRKVLVK